jgi:hypothetical protein
MPDRDRLERNAAGADADLDEALEALGDAEDELVHAERQRDARERSGGETASHDHVEARLADAEDRWSERVAEAEEAAARRDDADRAVRDASDDEDAPGA